MEGGRESGAQTPPLVADCSHPEPGSPTSFYTVSQRNPHCAKARSHTNPEPSIHCCPPWLRSRAVGRMLCPQKGHRPRGRPSETCLSDCSLQLRFGAVGKTSVPVTGPHPWWGGPLGVVSVTVPQRHIPRMHLPPHCCRSTRSLPCLPPQLPFLALAAQFCHSVPQEQLSQLPQHPTVQSLRGGKLGPQW